MRRLGRLLALATSLASSNAQVRAITPGVLDALIAGVDHGALIQPFANCVLYSPPKARPEGAYPMLQGYTGIEIIGDVK